VELFKKDRRQASSTLFPGSYFVFRHLALQVPPAGVQASSLPYSLTGRIINDLVPWLQNKAQNEAGWEQFRSIDEDRIALVEPVRVLGNVAPTSWWCTNQNCNKLFTGRLSTVGIENGECPDCHQRSIVQFPAIFVCPTCHAIETVASIQCPQCRDSRAISLRGASGRWSTFRWRCSLHEDFSVMLGKRCGTDQTRMVLKSAGGKVYHPENWSKVDPISTSNVEIARGSLRFRPSRATVLNVTIARVAVANAQDYYQGHERSTKEPFLDPISGSFIGFVSRIDTDAIVISSANRSLHDPVTLHSLEHGLMNAAPAVTGLTQQEFGSDLKDDGQIVFYDNVQGGSGGSRLLADRRLDRWLEVVRELAECHQVQCEDACRGCLFLPSTLCNKLNNELDRNTILSLF
jgi:hypothetical protein